MENERIARNLAAVEHHFHSEAVAEVEAALEMFTEDIVWEAPALNGLNRSFSGKEAVARNYRALFASMQDVKFQFLRRFATDEYVVDDSIVTFRVVQDGYWHFPLGSSVEMRLVHIFEMRGGKSAKEFVFDMGRVAVATSLRWQSRWARSRSASPYPRTSTRSGKWSRNVRACVPGKTRL